ncbi:MAG: hypothetical protein ACK48N_02625, partial [Planctomyces sp.]
MSVASLGVTPRRARGGAVCVTAFDSPISIWSSALRGESGEIAPAEPAKTGEPVSRSAGRATRGSLPTPKRP